MPNIRLQFVAERRWYSAPIRWFTHGQFDHVDIIGSDGLLYGARPIGGVMGRPQNYLPFSAVKIVEVPVTQAGYEAAWEFLRAQIGKPYDFGDLISFLLWRDWQTPDHWMCSALATAYARTAGAFPFPLSSPDAKIAPADLLLVLSAIAPV